MNADLGFLPFALIAALSPVALAATLAVIGAGRVQALAFAIGFVGLQFGTCALLVLLGGWTIPDRSGHELLRAVLEIVFGLSVLLLGNVVRRRPRNTAPSTSGRSRALVERLGRVHLLTALGAGMLLGVGGPKRLVMTALAAASIATSVSGGASVTAQVALYSAIATVFVWVPVLTFELLGGRAVALITRATGWIARHQRGGMLVTLLFVGGIAVIDGIVGLM